MNRSKLGPSDVIVLASADQPHNPMVNSGAIMSASILLYLLKPEMNVAQKYDYVFDFFKVSATLSSLSFIKQKRLPSINDVELGLKHSSRSTLTERFRCNLQNSSYTFLITCRKKSTGMETVTSFISTPS